MPPAIKPAAPSSIGFDKSKTATKLNTNTRASSQECSSDDDDDEDSGSPAMAASTTSSPSSSSASPAPATKRKADGNAKSGNAKPASSSSNKMVELAPGDELNLQRTTKKPGEGVVTKRTLQNRKAQREFRKRREARVRELEERCRRYDQMGIEANSELQRFARNLKEENEALRNFIVRIGCGNAIPSLLDGIQGQGSSGPQSAPGFAGQQPVFGQQAQMRPQSSQQQPIYGGMFGGTGAVTGGTFGGVNEPQFYNEPHNIQADVQKSGSIKPQDGKRSKTGSQGEKDTPLLSLKFSPEDNDRQQQQQQQQPAFAPDAIHTSQKLDQMQNRAAVPSPGGTGLSAFLANQAQQQQNSSNTGSGSGGSAMLFGGNGNTAGNGFGGPGTFAPMPIPQRSQQNAALLNPNPIPFAFNLSNDLNAQAPSSWWDQMGGGNENVELDEKAQAFADAQANGGGTQSPFDLTAFLNGGVTPGGGFQLGNPMDSISPAGHADGSNTGNATLASDTEHMRMFVNLIERKVAEREARTVASLGFQPPSQDPEHRKRSSAGKSQELQGSGPNSPAIRMSRSLTPSGVYSRLAQHPAFLSTNARELEELVDALGPVNSDGDETADKSSGRARAPSTIKDGNSTSSPLSQGHSPAGAQKQANVSATGTQPLHDGSTTSRSRSNSSLNSTDGRVQVDEGAIGKLLGLLDQKRGSNDSSTSTASGSRSSGGGGGGASGSKLSSNSDGSGVPSQQYTMTMA